ncbi:MAG: hypothetical protein RIR49_570 [Actinomycetota bacterium]
MSRRRLLAVVAGLVVLGLGYYVVTLVQVVVAGRERAVPPVDVVVVLGAAQYDGRPSAQLAARLDHAVTLWDSGGVGTIVVTGGGRPGDRFTEAEAARRHLVGAGVPAEVILAEDTGTTTWESMVGVAEVLDGVDVGSVILVTDPHHALRSRLIAEELGLVGVATSSTPTSVVRGGAAVRRHLVEAGGVAIGRVIGFERLSGRG